MSYGSEVRILALQEPEGRPSEEEQSSSSEDEMDWREELKRQRKEAKNNEEKRVTSKPKFYELKSGENFKTVKSSKTASALTRKKYVYLILGISSVGEGRSGEGVGREGSGSREKGVGDAVCGC